MKILSLPFRLAVLLGLACAAGSAAADVVTYEYDELGRLESATSPDARVTYGLDPAGNRVTLETTDLPGWPGFITVPTGSTSGTYDVTWGASPRPATRYELDESTDSKFESASRVYSGTSTTRSFTGVVNGTYYYRVRACNASACGSFRPGTNPIVVVVSPSRPASITVPSQSGTGNYTIAWAASSGNVTAYQLEEATDSGFSAPTLVYSGTATSTALSGRGDGTYYYRVRACENTACSVYREGANGIYVALPPGIPPSLTIPVTNSTGNYDVSWTAATGTVTAYQLDEARNEQFISATRVYDGPATIASFSSKANGPYYYRVRACNGLSCGEYRLGDYPVVVSVPPSVPATISVPENDVTGAYTIGWGGSSGELVAYELYEATNPSFTGQQRVYRGTANNGDVSGRDNGTYYYRVRACGTGSCSDYRTGSNPTVVTLPPGAPGSISVPSSNSTGSYSVSWGAASGSFTAYELYEATNPGFSGQVLTYSGTATSASVSGRASGSYYYRVRACNGPGCSGYRTAGNPVNVAIPPTAPPSVTAPQSSTSGSYTVSWGASDLATSYQLYEATHYSFNSQTLVYSGSALSAAVTGRTTGLYFYRVRACNGAGCSEYRTRENSTQVDTSPPSPPTNLAASVYGSSSVWLNWSGTIADTGSGWAGYRIYRNGVAVGTAATPTAQAYMDNNVPANVTHSYTVASFDNLGNESYSNTASAYIDTIPPSTPTNLQATAVLIDRVDLSWSPSTDDRGYVSYNVHRVGSGTSQSTTGTTSSDNTVNSNTTYTFEVRAIDGGGNSSPAASINVTTPPGAPSVPTISGTDTNNTSGNYTISWSASSGAVAYYLLEVNVNWTSWVANQINAPTTSQAYSNQSSADYYYRVRACTAQNVCSGYSNVRVITVCRNGCN